MSARGAAQVSFPEMRATFAAPLGPTHMLLPQYWQPEKQNDKALTAQTGGIALLHGALIYQPGDEPDVYQRMTRQKINFGDLSRAAWFPYWKPNPYLKLANSQIAASLYARGGDLFIVLFNTTKAKQTSKIEISQLYHHRFGATPTASLYDPVLDTSAAQASKDGITVELGPYATKLLTLKHLTGARKAAARGSGLSR